MDPSKGLFRRRPSTASTRSRLRGQPSSSSASASPSISGSGISNVIATNVAQSCPTSPSHSQVTRRSLGGQKIPEDEEARGASVTGPTSTTTTQPNNTTTNTGNNTTTATSETTTTSTTTTTTTTTVTLSPLIATASSSKEAAEYAAAISDAKREREALQKSPPAARLRNPRVSSAGSRLISSTAKARAAVSATVTAQQDELERCNAGNGIGGGSAGQTQLQRSASTVSGLSVRPYSSPAGLHAYTGKVPGSVPSSVHGSRVDLRDVDKGSAIYLGCSAPRNSTLSLSSRTSSGSSAPPSPVRTPPVSPRHGVRRAATMVKRQQQQQQQR
ncbi:uncharacterized protein DDB_G0271670-like [Rhagoletis pomonella]|uniref:uncharacterized protein DDB_G0271670-like n=1 Tax=Rhagoletis pomonella TaxID=28610 RepID=UPI00177F7C7B|nr:uncharacterized protein DDB_G0271670-like [Rhagoletis pomonella]XP_036326052.1 uncharacterized protein DDB_G0271670-like [Rhagoletis pomonella]